MVKHLLLIAAPITLIAAVVGCGGSSNTGASGTSGTTTQTADDHSHDEGEGDSAHGEWWCDEHGVPEEICAQCETRIAADFKAKGDWCEEHSRPDSQCFVCHPEKEVEFAALYEAKYGKKPPKPSSSGEAHEHDHDHEEKS